jgi:thiol:disulfide interchange protein DsbA
MKLSRRRLLRLLAASSLFAPALSYAELKEGVDFELVANAAPPPLGNEPVRIIEFFNYSCPACNSWYQDFEKWIETKPEYALWERTPLEFRRSLGLYARLHYVLEAFGRDEDVYAHVFKAIHQERELLNSTERVAAWLADKHDMNEDDVLEAFDSFSVNTKLKRARRRAEKFGITGTPSIVVANRYLLVPSSLGSKSRLFSVLTELTEAIHAGEAPI